MHRLNKPLPPWFLMGNTWGGVAARSEPAQTVEPATRLIDAADFPLAGEDRVVRPVLVDP